MTEAKEGKIIDADGVEIKCGSVLDHVKCCISGVVVEIVDENTHPRWEKKAGWLELGDLIIETDHGGYIVTSKYSEWQTIRRVYQTHRQRYHSFLAAPMRPEDKDYFAEGGCMTDPYIKSILPSEPDPNTDAMDLLVDYLDKLGYKTDLI